MAPACALFVVGVPLLVPLLLRVARMLEWRRLQGYTQVSSACAPLGTRRTLRRRELRRARKMKRSDNDKTPASHAHNTAGTSWRVVDVACPPLSGSEPFVATTLRYRLSSLEGLWYTQNTIIPKLCGIIPYYTVTVYVLRQCMDSLASRSVRNVLLSSIMVGWKVKR